MAKSFSRLIRRLVWILIGLSLIFFAVNNRTGVELSFEPLAGRYFIPVWWVLFAGIFLGIGVSAAVTSWLRLEGFTKRRKAERRADYLDAQMALMAEDAHEGRAQRAHKAASEDTEGAQGVRGVQGAASSSLAKRD
jgi:uncharacterized integral membrane protein